MWSIQMVDGRDIAIYADSLSERPAGARAPRVRRYESYELEAYTVQEQSLRLQQFRGDARSASGKLGRFEIYVDDVAAIRCRGTR
jgi:hypothetical protein